MIPLDEALKRFDEKFDLTCVGFLDMDSRYLNGNPKVNKYKGGAAYSEAVKSFLRSELEQARKEEREQFMDELKDLQVFVTDPDINARRDVVHKIDTILASLTERKEQS